MPARFQLVIDCTDPELLARFWEAALGYVLEPPPEGFATWDDRRRDIGLPDSELGIGADSIINPRGDGPRIWFRVEPEAKVVKNRSTSTSTSAVAVRWWTEPPARSE
jgi:hypothetical protein